MNSRRTFMEGVAALAAARWAEEDYDIEDAENWDTTDGNYTTGEFTPTKILAVGEGVIGGWRIGEDLTDHHLGVWYDSAGVKVDIQGDGDEFQASAMAELSPDEAREVAAAIYQAAEELDRRPKNP